MAKVTISCEHCGGTFEREAKVVNFARKHNRGVFCGKPCAGAHNRSKALVATPQAARFWEKVDKKGPTECWVWTGAGVSRLPRRNYGLAHKPGTNRGKVRAHRVSWEMHNGPIPDGLNVLHTCDNPPCVNPAHLFVGTQRDNVRDMYAKGRGRKRA